MPHDVRYNGVLIAMQAQISTDKPLRILHVVGALNPGGTETWLLRVLRHIDRERFQIDFLVHSEQLGAYDDEVRALGSKVLPCPGASRPWLYRRNFLRILAESGPYDIIHSHVHHFSGYILRLASRSGVPVRLAHSHSLNTRTHTGSGSLPRRLYLSLTERWVARYATAGLAASRPAASALFGPNWQADPRWRVLYCGIDIEPFRSTGDAATVRAELGLGPTDLVIGHVGRFTEQKNHKFLLQIASELSRREPRARFLLVGEGPLLPQIEQLAAQYGISDRIIFAHSRPDIPRLLVGAMDLFLFPSIDEGLGLSLVEAQAAGLPCVASDTVPQEAIVVPSLVDTMSLQDPASAWAETVLSVATQPSLPTRREALERVASSPFAIESSVHELTDFYARAWASSSRDLPLARTRARTSDAYH